jgi:hypothetical protein
MIFLSTSCFNRQLSIQSLNNNVRLSYQIAMDVDVTKGERQFSCVMRDVEGAVTQIETHLCQDGGWNVTHNWIFLKNKP